MKIPSDMKATNMSEAQALKLSAEELRCNASDQRDLIIADDLSQAADDFLRLEHAPQEGIGGELVLSDDEIPAKRNLNRINLEASMDRANLAHKNGVLSMALDTAEGVDASNAAEQMIAHQMAVAHRTALDLIAEAANIRDPIERCRMINTASKLMDICQKGLNTIHKVRNGGQQTVTVQHVQVGDGGQAVVNGSANIRGTEKNDRGV